MPSCFERKSAAAITSSTSPKKLSLKPGLSFPPRSDGYMVTIPNLRKASAVWSLSGEAALEKTIVDRVTVSASNPDDGGVFQAIVRNCRQVGSQFAARRI